MKGLNEEIIKKISFLKDEPLWMKEFRLRAYRIFKKKKMPAWGPDLSRIDFNRLSYYMKPTTKKVSSWQDLPAEIKKVYKEIGIPQVERDFLAGVNAQYDSEMVYERIKRYLGKEGVIFCALGTALKKHPQIIKKYLGKLIPMIDNKFAALNSAVWSGGSLIYIPKGVKVNLPLQAYFYIKSSDFGQFERTLIIADEGSEAQYIEGCTAPIYSHYSLHAGVVEVFVKKNARFRYTTVQNWTKNIYNLVTKRAKVEENGLMEWVGGNIGSRTTMIYPSTYLYGNESRGEMLSLTYAGRNQVQDTGAKMVHFGSRTTSRIIAKSVSKDGGIASYRGLVQILPQAKNSASSVSCDSLILDNKSRANTYPNIRIRGDKTRVEHEATVEKLSEAKLFYLQSRGIKKDEAESMLVNGFIKPITKEIPFQYALELNKLIRLEMKNKVG